MIATEKREPTRFTLAPPHVGRVLRESVPHHRVAKLFRCLTCRNLDQRASIGVIGNRRQLRNVFR